MRAILFPSLLLLILPLTPAVANSSRTGRAIAELHAVDAALHYYYQDHHRYPTAEEGLAILKPTSGEARSGYYEGPLIDPWGGEYQYLPGGGGSSEPYRLYSFGRDSCSASLGHDPDDVRCDSPLPEYSASALETAFGLAALVIEVGAAIGLFLLFRLAWDFRRQAHS